MRKLWLVLGGVLVFGAMTAGVAQARLDPTFGQNGVVEVKPPFPAGPGWSGQYIRRLAAARSGSSYALVERQGCIQGNCFGSDNLFRYLPDGTLDPAFGGPSGFYEMPPGESIPALAVDSLGRPLLARANSGQAVIIRLTSSGFPDPSFGSGGLVELECDCQYGGVQLVPGPGGTVTAVFSRGHFGSSPNDGYGRNGTIFNLVHFRADGSVERSFGRRGGITFAVPGAEPFNAAATGKGGAIYLGGEACCGSNLWGYVVRVSAKGRLDSRFTAAAQHSLRSLRRLHGLEESVNAVIPRPGGKIDLLGSAGFEKGFEMRMRPNGHLIRRFGKRGLRALSLPVQSAALGSDGATIAVGERRGGSVIRLLPGGRLDSIFGVETIPGGGGGQLSVVPQTGRKALVLDLGVMECRYYCEAKPRLARFLEGPPPKRR